MFCRKPVYAQRISSLAASKIRELLKITERPDIISFAGGLPASELFPMRELEHFVIDMLPKSSGPRLRRTAPTIPIYPQFTCGVELRLQT